jgi:quercetin dioxygenase-like cupin family protein/type 1 glutamine amidotransferase
MPVGHLAWGAQSAKEIVLIGGVKSHGPAQHDFPNGIRLLKDFLQTSPDLEALGTNVAAYPDGWPGEHVALENASTIVWYFDGLGAHPMLDAARRARFEQLMRKGVGLVALHQASTLPPEDRQVDLPQWLGAARYGMFDRTTEMVEFKPAAHPISRGVDAFSYQDEFYPTLRFAAGQEKVVPILTGTLHIQIQNDQPIITRTQVRPVAWAFERAGGGRSFGFTGLHYLVSLDQPQLRKLLLNAIVWTAGLEVPKAGVRSSLPDAATKIKQQAEEATRKTVTEAVVTRRSDHKVIDYPWGQLTWYVSRELKNSDTMTVGQAMIKPGQQNPRHFHPNCDEVLTVLQGRILHSMNDRTVEMRVGDTVSIPMGVMHNASNIGTEDAVLAISFSSADRQVVGE